MALGKLDAEDIALLGSIIASGAAVIADEVSESTLYKVLKITALLMSLGLAIHRIRTGRPYFKDIQEPMWEKAEKGYIARVARREHGRGKFPYARCLVPNGHGGFAECFLDPDVRPDGSIILRSESPTRIRLEVRK